MTTLSYNNIRYSPILTLDRSKVRQVHGVTSDMEIWTNFWFNFDSTYHRWFRNKCYIHILFHTPSNLLICPTIAAPFSGY